MENTGPKILVIATPRGADDTFRRLSEQIIKSVANVTRHFDAEHIALLHELSLLVEHLAELLQDEFLDNHTPAASWPLPPCPVYSIKREPP